MFGVLTLAWATAPVDLSGAHDIRVRGTVVARDLMLLQRTPYRSKIHFAEVACMSQPSDAIDE